ncbi:MAG: rod shape-determining protein MreC [Candidatus Eisenbacteria bacterium]
MANILPPAERRSVILVMTYAALSLFLLVVGERIPTAALRSAGATVFEPFDRVALWGDRALMAWRENQELHRRITTLELQNRQLRGAQHENQSLRAQLGLPEWRGLVVHPVEVLALSGDPTPTAATLSAGAKQGVKVGDAVMTSDGLIGRVSEVYGTLSRASLLTDPNLAVACEVESTGVNGILRYTPSPLPRLLITAVPLADTIRLGERVMTSDLSVRFPRGIPVGTVTRMTRDATGLMQEIEVWPAAQLSRMRHAFIVPGPTMPVDGMVRPRLEFEPVRSAVTGALTARDSTKRAR